MFSERKEIGEQWPLRKEKYIVRGIRVSFEEGAYVFQQNLFYEREKSLWKII